MRRLLALGWLLLALARPAGAHELQPGLLQLVQTAPDTYQVLWKVPATSAGRLALTPRFPRDCELVRKLEFATGDGFVERARLVRAGGLDGAWIEIEGLAATRTDVVARIERLDGGVQTVRLTPAATRFRVEPPKGWQEVAATYMRRGMQHILPGLDHLLLVLGLILIVRGRRMLLATVTAFTLAHSVTLALATAGWARVPLPPLNAAIAPSIVALGAEVARAWRGGTSLTLRRPWSVAFVFGLPHGFGFASGLTALGVPRGELLAGLLWFNVGVELGQVGFVLLALALARAYAVLELVCPEWVRRLPGYAPACAAFSGRSSAPRCSCAEPCPRSRPACARSPPRLVCAPTRAPARPSFPETVMSLLLPLVPLMSSLLAPLQTATPAAARSTDMVALVTRFSADREALRRAWPVEGARRTERMRGFGQETLAGLEALDFAALDLEGRIDWVLLRYEVEKDLRDLDLAARRREETAPLLPFVPRIAGLIDVPQRLEPVDPQAAATSLHALLAEVEAARKAAEDIAAAKPVLLRAARQVESAVRGLEDWHGERSGYDPWFSWWVDKPHAEALEELRAFARYLREERAGLESDDQETIVGDPIGREALLVELEGAMIAYSPEELLEIADRELAWCRARMLEAARELGLGEDWRAALEATKRAHVPPGGQPALIRALAEEAADYVQTHGLVSVPPLARESWRMEMMTPQRQLVNPFFTGGEVISVAFPTSGMGHEQKLMSLRGNNEHFARATVHHELIPGHHLQQFMNARHMPHRRVFATPFWTEGWALWWEMLLWERGFARDAKDRMGMLFWRSHRCARIRFSLAFHLGQWSPQECIDFLVGEIGHERENAAAEVRRSFDGSYGPLYQLAYMVGALQLKDLHRELVQGGKMDVRAFHDGVLQGGTMPIEMVRARLSGVAPAKGFVPAWRF